MSIRIMSNVWADHSIKSRSELLVLLALADFSGDDKPAFPSIDTLAMKSRCTQRGVQKVLARLIADSKLVIEYGKGPSGTNLYSVIWGGVNGVHPEPSVPKKEPKKGTVGSPNPSGSVRNGHETDTPLIPHMGEMIPRGRKPPPRNRQPKPEASPERRAEEKLRLGKLFGRRQSTIWSAKELKAWKEISPIDEEDFQSVERYYGASIPADKNYRRRDLQTLLNNFSGEVDRARTWKEPNPW
jgi:hypothetical protein